MQISGSNNRLEGSPVFTSDIIFQDDNTDATFALQGNVNKNVALNGGTISLANDLTFISDQILTGSGSVCGNGYKLSTGNKPFTWTSDLLWKDQANLELHACKIDLVGTFTFNGESSINGHGNVLDISSGDIVVSEN